MSGYSATPSATLLNSRWPPPPRWSSGLEGKADQVTLVPEKRQELTTEGGLKVRGVGPSLRSVIRRLQAKGIPVSLFINPNMEDVRASTTWGPPWWNSTRGSTPTPTGRTAQALRVRAIQKAARLGHKMGLGCTRGMG
jgi:pyridoxine 5-phosphate synthase